MRPDSIDEFEQGESVTDPTFREKLNALREVANSVRSITGGGRIRVSQDNDGVVIYDDGAGDGGSAIVDVLTVKVTSAASPPAGESPLGWYSWEEVEADDPRSSASEGPMREVNGRQGMETDVNVFMWVTANGKYRFDTSYSTRSDDKDPSDGGVNPYDQGAKDPNGDVWDTDLQPATDWNTGGSDHFGVKPMIVTRFRQSEMGSNEPARLYTRRFRHDSTGNLAYIEAENAFVIGTITNVVSSVYYNAGTLTIYKMKINVLGTVADGTQVFQIGSASGADTYKVMVTGSDASPDYLNPKITTDAVWISSSVQNAGANENLLIYHIGPGTASGSSQQYTHLSYDINEANVETTGLQIYPSHGTTTFDAKGHRIASGTTSNGNWFYVPQVIGDLADVSSNAPNDGDVLTYDNGVGEWVPGTVAVTEDIFVKVSSADTTAGYLNSKLTVTGPWVTKAIQNGGANENLLISHGLGTAATSGTTFLQSVAVSGTVAGVTGATVTFTSGTINLDAQNHVFSIPVGGTTAVKVPQTINDLSDVDTTGAANTNLLQFNGTVWVPASLSTQTVVTDWRLNGTTFEYKTRSIYCLPAGAESGWTQTSGDQPVSQSVVYDTDYTDPNFKEFKRPVYVFAPGATTSTTVFTTATC